MINTGSLLPLAVGLGAGAALMYYFSPERNQNQTRRINYLPPVRHDVNARNLSDTSTLSTKNAQANQTETKEIITAGARTNEEDTFVKGTEKGRSASRGNS